VFTTPSFARDLPDVPVTVRAGALADAQLARQAGGERDIVIMSSRDGLNFDPTFM
tara:strand:- start:266 stop:430 length:165 start_codon:yes stop_codon:yes gene_type:complete